MSAAAWITFDGDAAIVCVPGVVWNYHEADTIADPNGVVEVQVSLENGVWRHVNPRQPTGELVPVRLRSIVAEAVKRAAAIEEQQQELQAEEAHQEQHRERERQEHERELWRQEHGGEG